MIRIYINGVVQGVGFRPFVYRLAHLYQLRGYVLNSSAGVEIEVVGEDSAISAFIKAIKETYPPGARIDTFRTKQVTDKPLTNFEIRSSLSDLSQTTLISPDLATCPDCVREMNSPANPRYGYAFINCTNCGPRYSIIENTPYDRPQTSMKSFRLCDYCGGEYTDPLNRRFHAQPVACAECGPELSFSDENLKAVTGNPISLAKKMLKAGKIVGIKGIGGFHIACDATNEEAITELRKRKTRPHKPFAIMTKHEHVEKIANVGEREHRLLRSSAAPIVLLPKGSFLPEILSPENPNLGVFLPYAPLHYLLLDDELPYLVMTSGNLNSEPITAEEVQLKGLCDAFLTHNRPILNRCDDSVIRPATHADVIIRRSRGFVPLPVELPFSVAPTLGTGAELKLTFALGKGRNAYLSPYIGNSETKSTTDFYLETLEKYKKWFDIEPEKIACDLHPDYATTHFAKASGLPVVRVQHHVAHVAAVMAEHQLTEPIIGIAYDGTGYGDDGKIWGGEIFRMDYTDYERLYHLEYMPLPSRDAAIRHPVRIAYSWITHAGLDASFLRNISPLERKTMDMQLSKNFNIIETSSMGRLFDCVASLLGLYPEISFEAQSAMALEFLCGSEPLDDEQPYPVEFSGKQILLKPVLKEIVCDLHACKDSRLISRRFHRTIVSVTLASARKIRQNYGLTKVVLSGGVLQNRILLDALFTVLQKNNFTVYTPCRFPLNDGSISVGQMIIAGNRTKR
ncbi:MAG: carbamoyltransferase HypF [Candidatus Cloacimonetes bacterium]|nr:carbamoyltransferase HypF [Candidatus Cloacimonadota bacterium]